MTVQAGQPDDRPAPGGTTMGHSSPGKGVLFVFGTRPELVKLAPLIRLLGDEARIVHTGQHYSVGLYRQILADLRLPCAVEHLGAVPARRGAQLGSMVAGLDRFLARDRVRMVVVQGDTTSALAGALAANACDTPLVHVEAGLRSHDRGMPEEHNRVMIDHIADLCCAPTAINRQNLLRENVPDERIVVTGNTVVAALLEALPTERERLTVVETFGLEPERYVLATLHRPENVDVATVLEVVLRQLSALPSRVLMPMHPRTAARIRMFGLGHLLRGLQVTEPLGYRDFLSLVSHAAVVVSDSGGVQEEVSVLKRPAVVVRRSTERPEIEGSFGRLVPAGSRIGEVVREWLGDVPGLHRRLAALPSPYGDGTAAERIAEAVRASLGQVTSALSADGSGGHSSPHMALRAAR